MALRPRVEIHACLAHPVPDSTQVRNHQASEPHRARPLVNVVTCGGLPWRPEGPFDPPPPLNQNQANFCRHFLQKQITIARRANKQLFNNDLYIWHGIRFTKASVYRVPT